MTIGFTRRAGLKGSVAAGTTMLFAPLAAQAQALKGGTLRVALLADIVNYDPHQFSAVNMPVMKNMYDALIDHAEARLGIGLPSGAYSISASYMFFITGMLTAENWCGS